MYDKKYIQQSNRTHSADTGFKFTESIFYGTVESVEDPTDGGRIKVRINRLDNGITGTTELAWAYPLLPKFFHVMPQRNEVVRVFIQDIQYPQRGRFWLGSIISQPQKIEYDKRETALSTVDDMRLLQPLKAPSQYPDADGVFPAINDVAVIGKVNTDVILRLNQVGIRAGKHEPGNPLKLNTKNPAEIRLTYEQPTDEEGYQSNTTIMSDKIALISHSGNPKFKAARLETSDRTKIFEEGHPLVRGDVLVKALNIMRQAIINHVHGYSAKPADRNAIIKDLQAINFDGLIQENIVIN
jgi:hypothetical protein